MKTPPNALLWKLVGLCLVATIAACQVDGGGDTDNPDTDNPGADDASEPLGESEDPLCFPVDPARSVVVTDPGILALFPLQAVLSQIIASAGGPGPTPLGLYQQWFDNLNDPVHGVTAGPHCTGMINGFPVDCPRQEGMLAATNPFVPGPDAYIPLALFNRFDLADGTTDCGEYRIVYGKESGLVNPLDRNFLIFEGRLPNPGVGLAACLPVADFWANLTTIPSVATRAALLQSFYFTGIAGFAPVISWDHYAGAGAGSGQIRTNMFMKNRPYFGPPLNQDWELREYRSEIICGAGCNVMFTPVPVKNNPSPAEFNPGTAGAFKANFVGIQVSLTHLARPGGVNDFKMEIPISFDAGQSVSLPIDDYTPHATGVPFLTDIGNKLAFIGSPLTVTNILDRATCQSCAGCHQLSNGKNLGGFIWPSSLGFVHTNENRILSPALTGTFIPKRKQVLEDCICGVTC